MKKKIFAFLSLVGVSAIVLTVGFSAIKNYGVYATSVENSSDYTITIGMLTSKIKDNKLVFKSDGGSEVKYNYPGYREEYRLDDYFYVFGGEEDIALTPIVGESRIRTIKRVVIQGQRMHGMMLYKAYRNGDTFTYNSDYPSFSPGDETQSYDLRGAKCSYICFKKEDPNSNKKSYVNRIIITYSCSPGSEDA